MTRPRLLIALAVLAGLGGAVALVSGSGALRDLLGRRGPAATLRVSGNIEAHESVLSLKNVQSRIVELPFDEGASVRRGTLIARVDDADYRQQVAIAQAAVAVQEQQLQTAKSTLDAATRTLAADEADLRYKTLDDERVRRLATQGFQSVDARDLADAALAESRAALERDRALQRSAQSNVALAEANVRSARESLQLAQINEGYTTLTAPIDGVILVRQAELGEVVAPGTPIVTLADLDHVWLRAYVNEPDLGRVHFGQSVVVTTDNQPGRRYGGRIGFISEQAEFTPKSVETYAERVTLVYRIRIDIDNPQHELVPGMPADAEIALDATPAR